MVPVAATRSPVTVTEPPLPEVLEASSLPASITSPPAFTSMVLALTTPSPILDIASAVNRDLAATGIYDPGPSVPAFPRMTSVWPRTVICESGAPAFLTISPALLTSQCRRRPAR